MKKQFLPSKGVLLLTFCAFLHITKTKGQTKTPNTRLRQIVLEWEGLAGKDVLLTNLTGIFEYQGTTTMRFGGVEEYNISANTYEFWKFYDVKLARTPVYASVDFCTDIETPKLHYGGIGFKTHLQDFPKLKEYFVYASIGVHYIFMGTAEIRMNKPELNFLIITEPIPLFKKTDLVIQSWGRIRSGNDVVQIQLGLKHHDYPLIAFLGAAQWGVHNGHPAKWNPLFGFQYEFNK